MNLIAEEPVLPSEHQKQTSSKPSASDDLRQAILRFQKISKRLKFSLTTTMDEFHYEMEVFTSSDQLHNRIYLEEVQKFLELCHESAKLNFNEAYYHRVTKILRLWMKLKLCCYIEDADKLCQSVHDFVERNLSGSIQKSIIDVLLVIPRMFKSRATRFHSKTRSINACKIIFQRYLGQRQSTSLELDDENFVKHMLCYRAWRNIETDNKRKIEINLLFVGNVRPRNTLIANPKLAPMLPFYYPSEPGAYVTLIEQIYCTEKLHQQLDASFKEELLQDFISPICCIEIDSSSDDDVDANKKTPQNMSNIIDLCDDSIGSNSPVILHESLIQERKCYMPIETHNQITADQLRTPDTSLLQSTPQNANSCTSENVPFDTPSLAGQILSTCSNAVQPKSLSSDLPPINSKRQKYICQSKEQPIKRWKRGESLRSVCYDNKLIYTDYYVHY